MGRPRGGARGSSVRVRFHPMSMTYLEEVHMNVVSSISGAALAIALSAAPAYASAPIACSTRVDSFLNASRSDGKRVLGIGSAVTARGALGFTHFAMAQGYHGGPPERDVRARVQRDVGRVHGGFHRGV